MDDLDAMSDGIALLLSWRKTPPFRARSFVRAADDDEREFDIEVWPSSGSYKSVRLSTGETESYCWRSRRIETPGGRVFSYTPDLLLFEPSQVRLALPLTLPIWGRSSLEYVITGGERVDNLIKLRLLHRTADNVRSTLTIDGELRRAIEFETPSESLELAQFEVLDSDRLW